MTNRRSDGGCPPDSGDADRGSIQCRLRGQCTLKGLVTALEGCNGCEAQWERDVYSFLLSQSEPFTRRVVMTDGTGYPPAVDEFPEDAVDWFSTRSIQSGPSVAVARLSDFLWVRRGDYVAAGRAIEAYVAWSSEIREQEPLQAVAALARASQLAVLLNRPLEALADSLFELARHLYEARPSVAAGLILACERVVLANPDAARKNQHLLESVAEERRVAGAYRAERVCLDARPVPSAPRGGSASSDSGQSLHVGVYPRPSGSHKRRL